MTTYRIPTRLNDFQRQMYEHLVEYKWNILKVKEPGFYQHPKKKGEFIPFADLLKVLVNKNVLSVDDYELLVMRGHMFPQLIAMDESNWQGVKTDLLHFLDEKNWRRVDSRASKGDRE